MTIADQDLIKRATEATRACRALAPLKEGWNWMGYVGAALVTDSGSIFTGINLSLECGIGFCAEHSAIAEMVKHGETKISRIAATTEKGTVIPPCGRCRELMFQIDNDNLETVVLLGNNRVLCLKDLLPERWQESFDAPLG